jgi:hypothetical protein
MPPTSRYGSSSEMLDKREHWGLMSLCVERSTQLFPEGKEWMMLF